MKTILTAILVTLLATQAFAQMGKPRPSGDGNAPKGEDVQKRRAAEDAAAKAAMSKIPDSKEKYDPWKIAR
ncbi:MAG: hypothetical protein NTZ72_06355 [Afipia sp.]|jgi:hypothetical protein|nr:hypothetical protein [Afipia sp.]